MRKVDFVVTYVDGTDEKWRSRYEEACWNNNRFVDMDTIRYRDWGTLRYVFRGVERNMPWTGKVFLVVESETQIPKWVNRKTVNIVFHKDFIPEEYLPTFNSTCIELFLWRIKGLGERFIYGNDDMFAISPIEEDEFYKGNTPHIRYNRKEFKKDNMYQNHLHNGEALVRKILSMEEHDATVIRTGHNIHPMLKKTWRTLWDMGGDELEASVSIFRQWNNINQDVCSFYHLLIGDYRESGRYTKYMEFKDIEEVENTIMHSDAQLICLNDAKASVFEKVRERVVRAFERRLPNKSKYEL